MPLLKVDGETLHYEVDDVTDPCKLPTSRASRLSCSMG
jgi:hypothetical protein